MAGPVCSPAEGCQNRGWMFKVKVADFYHTGVAYLYKKSKIINYVRRGLPEIYKKYILKIEAERTEEKNKGE